jgi:hypothetical protein
VAPLASTKIFFTSGESTVGNINETNTWAAVGSLSGAWVAVFMLFLLLMNPSHRCTFYSTETSKQWVCNFFTKEGATDEQKFMGISRRRALWDHLSEDVKEWTLANWVRFEREQPRWFIAGRIALVDDEFIPPDSLEGRRRAGGSSRRRNSMSERLIGRLSMREEGEEGGGARVVPEQSRAGGGRGARDVPEQNREEGGRGTRVAPEQNYNEGGEGIIMMPEHSREEEGTKAP